MGLMYRKLLKIRTIKGKTNSEVRYSNYVMPSTFDQKFQNPVKTDSCSAKSSLYPIT